MEPYPFFGPKKRNHTIGPKRKKKKPSLERKSKPVTLFTPVFIKLFQLFRQKKKIISTICNYINSYIMKPSEKCFKVPSPSEVGSFCFHYIWSEDFTPNLTESYPKRKKKLIRFHSSIAVGLHEEYQGYHDRI